MEYIFILYIFWVIDVSTFAKLFNGENENTIVQLNDSFDDTNRRFVRRIQESKGQRSLEKDERGQSDGPWWYPNQGVEMSWGYSYSMANQDIQQYLSIEQDALEVEKKHIGINLQEQGRYPKLY